MSLAGIYTPIENKVTFAILMKEASLLFARIHNKKNRQLMMLSLNQEKDGLKDALDQEEIKAIMEKD